MSAPLLEMEGIHFAYAPDRVVLSDLSLAIAPGERVGLAGPIGAGKSTLIGVAMGLIAAEAGEIRLFGQTCRTERDFLPARLRCGVLFQDPDDQLFCPTVGEDVAFGPLNQGLGHAEAADRVAEALALVGLEGFEARVTYRLSGGEKRLAALAGALAMRPELLLLDEPLAGLDPDCADRIVRVLAATETAMLVVSHQQAELAPLLTRRLQLRNARLEVAE